ncbi:antibiotic biosynthesis monooxygenase [Chromobacterium sp. IIBBL 290-4]|uniref:antibiotic biosynthesis monooxygenase family protein n=1 Tax=Chromobacterium sp. IIBBL 290-4 TaxID=2953890 RepID=UPI0020B85582|nr:antibiotic biosynthesis monooxygenase family protein [Chromobacterium sp. IIBBL 290-4]UTH72986.1 antibiotic biosynthesis monooxygenase [Chromobacterium sp. IIBBL 290-4]
MIVEIVRLRVKPGQLQAFETAWAEASGRYLRGKPGYQAHKLGRQLETERDYVLAVQWDSLDAHLAFMAHADFQPFAQSFWHFFDGEPDLIHFQPNPAL